MTSFYLDLFGWDTAYAISYTQANAAIKALGSSPQNFDYQSVNTQGVTVASITGTWGDWELTTKGDGQNVTFKCPVTSGEFYSLMDGATFDLTGTWVEVEVKLVYIEQDSLEYFDPTSNGSGTQNNLVTRTESSDPLDPPVSIVASTFYFSSSFNPDMTQSICEGAFKSWFTENIDEFNHVFSIFVINETADKGDFQWLKPTGLGYAVKSTDSMDTSVFGVMAMTEGRPQDGNTHTIDPRMLTSAGASSAFSISGPRFVDKWILPGLLTMKLGSTDNDYETTGDQLFLENIVDLVWGSFYDKHNNPVPAKVKKGNFRIGIIGTQMKVEFTDLHWDYIPGVTVHVNYTEYYEITLKSGKDKNGNPYKNILSVNTAGDPNLQVTLTTATWKQWLDIGIEIGIAVIGSLVGGLIGAAADAAAQGVTAAAEAAEEAAEESAAEMVTMELTDTLAETASMSEQTIDEISMETSVEAGEDVSEAVEMEAAGESSEAISSKIASKVRSFGNWMWGIKWKLIGGMVGGAVGAALGSIPKIIENTANGYYSDLPSLDEFGENCVGSVKWPNSSGFELQTAQLEGALLLGGELIPVPDEENDKA